MTNYTKDAIDFAFENKLSDMQSAIQDAIRSKISDALEVKKVEVAQGMFGVTEAWHDDEDDDVAKADRELARMKAKPIKAANIDTEKDKIKKSKKDKEEEMDESYIEEKLDASMGVKKYIDDFIKSDNPKFEGKSKKERIQMALGAYYSAKKGKTRNEEVEELEELSKKTLGSYVKKAASDAGDKAYAAGMEQGDSTLPTRKAIKYTEKETKRQKGIGKAVDRLTKED